MKYKYLRILGFIFYAYILRYLLTFIVAFEAGIKGFKEEFKYALEDFPCWKNGMSNKEAIKTAWKVLNEEDK